MRPKDNVMIWLLALLLLLASGCARPAAQAPYDLLIVGGSVLNGDGTPGVSADIGVPDGKIRGHWQPQGGPGASADRRLWSHRRARLHRHAQPFGLHDPRGTEVREHDPAGRHDDGARGVAVGRSCQTWRERRCAIALRRRDGRLDDAWRLFREARTS